MRRFCTPLPVLLVALLAVPATAQDTAQKPVATNQKTESAKPALPKDALGKAVHEQLGASNKYRHSQDLKQFYEQNGYRLVWLEEDGDWKRKPEDFIEAIAKADLDGLKPESYSLQAVAKTDVQGNIKDIVRKDLALTDALLAYIDDLHNGVVEPQQVFPKFFTPEDAKSDLAMRLKTVLDARNAEDALQAQAPQAEEYKRLREALANYRAIANKGGWVTIDDSGETIKPGWTDERIPAIRERLRTLGRIDDARDLSWFDKFRSRFDQKAEESELPQDKPSKMAKDIPEEEVAQAREHPDWVYNDELVSAIERFQERRGAKVDGVIGPETLAELNIPIEGRIDQILLAMEQWRWLPQELGSRYVFVNTAGYYAKGIADGKTVVNTPVIVGEVAHQTPSFSSYITNVKFYPDWTVPSSIAQRYVLDKLQKNPAAIDSLGYQLYNGDTQVTLDGATVSGLSTESFPPYQFRQKPGPDNALGLVRFSVDNDYAIYLHDTPNDALFANNSRNFSSGCVRVGEPTKLAQFLLVNNSPLSAGQVKEKFAVASGADLQTEIVPLEHKIPVHIMYMTAWVDDGGVMHFESDAYSRDEALKKAMGL